MSSRISGAAFWLEIGYDLDGLHPTGASGGTSTAFSWSSSIRTMDSSVHVGVVVGEVFAHESPYSDEFSSTMRSFGLAAADTALRGCEQPGVLRRALLQCEAKRNPRRGRQ